MTTRWRSSPARRNTTPVACPTLSASSGVITPLARPRIPSVPKYLRAISPHRLRHQPNLIRTGYRVPQKIFRNITLSRKDFSTLRAVADRVGLPLFGALLLGRPAACSSLARVVRTLGRLDDGNRIR